MRAHELTRGDAVQALASDARAGLAEDEAKARLARYGPNKLPEARGPGRLERLWGHLRSGMILLLLGAAVLSLALGDDLDAVVIMAIVLLNVAVGWRQESRAAQAARSVRRLLAPTATIVRDGRAAPRPAAELVPGDVVLLVPGDRVPADGRWLDATVVEIDESALTGESLPVPKRADPPAPADAPLAERATMAFAGTTQTQGRGRLLVCSTGAETELGRIAGAIATTSPRTPLQVRLDGLAANLLRAASAAAVILAGLAVLHGEGIVESGLVGISLAVAAVPEGLPAVVTVALALGVRELARHSAIVRRLEAVEALGSTTVICTDKTGTLTEGRMSLARAWLPGGTGEVDVAAADSDGEVRALLEAALLASAPSGDHAAASAAADPTERAIVEAAQRAGLEGRALLDGRTLGAIAPFDPIRKRMEVAVEESDGERATYVKGAPQPLAGMPKDDVAELEAAAERWAGEGLRVLMVARVGDGESPHAGLLGLSDAPRAAVTDSIGAARRAGIRTIVVSGDHPGTVRAIAAATGAADHDAAVLTGPQLDELSDGELSAAVRATTLFARVVPEHKVRIVQALRRDGEVVAMIGDGVNDAPALRAADIGVAMGQRGTDAAVAAADVVLADDNYGTLVRAVRAGRAIFESITRFTTFLLTANLGEVFVFAVCISVGLSAPLTVLQILVVNLLTDGLPATALVAEPIDPRIMSRAPRPLSEGIAGPYQRRLIVGGLAVGIAALGAFLIGDATSKGTGQTMAFTALVLSELIMVFAMRTNDWFFRAGRNLVLYVAVAGSAAIQAVLLAVDPVARRFDVVGLSAGQLAAALLLSVMPFAAVEIEKRWTRSNPPTSSPIHRFNRRETRSSGRIPGSSGGSLGPA